MTINNQLKTKEQDKLWSDCHLNVLTNENYDRIAIMPEDQSMIHIRLIRLRSDGDPHPTNDGADDGETPVDVTSTVRTPQRCIECSKQRHNRQCRAHTKHVHLTVGAECSSLRWIVGVKPFE